MRPAQSVYPSKTGGKKYIDAEVAGVNRDALLYHKISVVCARTFTHDYQTTEGVFEKESKFSHGTPKEHVKVLYFKGKLKFCRRPGCHYEEFRGDRIPIKAERIYKNGMVVDITEWEQNKRRNGNGKTSDDKRNSDQNNGDKNNAG